MAYDFKLEYRPGAKNPADGPSRRPDHLQEDNVPLLDRIPTLQVKLQNAQGKHATSHVSSNETSLVDSGTKVPESFVPQLRAARAAMTETAYESTPDDLRELLGKA